MATPTRNQNKAKDTPRGVIIKGIDNPLGFFVLALLIVETFLTLVLTYGDIKTEDKPTYINIGCALFVLVTILVTLLVWFKPENLTFDRNAHLNRAKEPFGSDQALIKASNRFGNPTSQE